VSAPYRAETVGSLLRPPFLKEAKARFEAGEIPDESFRAIENRAVDEAIALQEDAGLDVVSDGELRRATFMGPLWEAMDGLAPIPSWTIHWTHAGTGEEMDWRMPVSITGKLRRTRSLASEEYAYARDRASKPLKQTLPSPLLANGVWNPDVSQDAYPDPWELLEEAAVVIAEEARALAKLGCTYIQIDAPEIGTWADPTIGPVHPANGIPIDRLLSEGLDLVNSVPEGIDGVTFGLHLCKGNNTGHYTASGGYETISRSVFGRLQRYDVFLLEYDDERSGGFEPLRDCPDEKTVVLGLISSKLPALEDQDEVAARVDEAARYHPRGNLALSTQCGFASVEAGNPLSESEQRAKLELVAGLAHRLWP
jgi:methionine synthase II (cobalamin-independent)